MGLQQTHEVITLEFTPAGAVRIDADLDDIFAGCGVQLIE